jgi:hypothetical protein
MLYILCRICRFTARGSFRVGFGILDRGRDSEVSLEDLADRLDGMDEDRSCCSRVCYVEIIGQATSSALCHLCLSPWSVCGLGLFCALLVGVIANVVVTVR